MLAISAMVTPPEDDGGMEMTVWSRYTKVIASRQAAL
jgi:hypothetical protein